MRGVGGCGGYVREGRGRAIRRGPQGVRGGVGKAFLRGGRL